MTKLLDSVTNMTPSVSHIKRFAAVLAVCAALYGVFGTTEGRMLVWYVTEHQAATAAYQSWHTNAAGWSVSADTTGPKAH